MRAEIHVTDNGSAPRIELKGSTDNLLIAWGWLTLAMCDQFGLSERKLAEKLPWMVGKLRGSLRGKTVVDLEAISRSREEAEPDDHD